MVVEIPYYIDCDDTAYLAIQVNMTSKNYYGKAVSGQSWMDGNYDISRKVSTMYVFFDDIGLVLIICAGGDGTDPTE